MGIRFHKFFLLKRETPQVKGAKHNSEDFLLSLASLLRPPSILLRDHRLHSGLRTSCYQSIGSQQWGGGQSRLLAQLFQFSAQVSFRFLKTHLVSKHWQSHHKTIYVGPSLLSRKTELDYDLPFIPKDFETPVQRKGKGNDRLQKMSSLLEATKTCILNGTFQNSSIWSLDVS